VDGAPRRVLLKLSGEVLAGDAGQGIDATAIGRLAEEIRDGIEGGTQLAIVIGGGNIVRGTTAAGEGFDRATGDAMGMLATVINALALQDALEHRSLSTRVMTAIEMRSLAEPCIRRRAVRHLEKGRVVIFAAGTGNPYFTTDTAAALRATEIRAEAFLKATQVDGIYTADPRQDPDATLLREVSYQEALEKRLKVLDSTAFSLCQDNRMPIHVFRLQTKGNILRVLRGDPVGSVVR